MDLIWNLKKDLKRERVYLRRLRSFLSSWNRLGSVGQSYETDVSNDLKDTSDTSDNYTDPKASYARPLNNLGFRIGVYTKLE